MRGRRRAPQAYLKTVKLHISTYSTYTYLRRISKLLLYTLYSLYWILLFCFIYLHYYLFMLLKYFISSFICYNDIEASSSPNYFYCDVPSSKSRLDTVNSIGSFTVYLHSLLTIWNLFHSNHLYTRTTSKPVTCGHQTKKVLVIHFWISLESGCNSIHFIVMHLLVSRMNVLVQFLKQNFS